MTMTSPVNRTDAPFRDECLRPPAVAQVWVGVGQPHEAIAVPGVALGRGDVIVAVELATICGSDVHTVSGHRSAPTPLVLGHESVGRITAIGDAGVRDVDGRALELGDRIVWSIAASCGACDRCLRGITQKCRSLRKYGHERVEPRWELSGGFASHVHVRAGTPIVRVGEELPATVLAPASCATATAWAALARAERVRDLDGALVAVSGAGLVGLTAAAMAVDRGATVIVSDPSKARRRLARRFGAAHTVDPLRTTGSHTMEAALAATGRDEIDVVIEASGSAAAVATAFDIIGTGSVVILVGSVFPGGSIDLDPERIVRGLVTVAGVHNYTAVDLRDAASYLRARAHAWPFAEVVATVLPLDDIDEAIVLAAGGASLRIGIDPRR